VAVVESFSSCAVVFACGARVVVRTIVLAALVGAVVASYVVNLAAFWFALSAAAAAVAQPC